MITDRLFDSILIDPAREGAEELYIVSGYATAAMAFHHMQRLQSLSQPIRIRLIIGMCAQDGLTETNHRGLQQLMQTDFSDSFECSYLTGSPPVHSKVYVWARENTPIRGFAGSANYTQTAFGDTQREAMEDSDPGQGLDYFRSLVPQTIYCTHSDAENLVQIYNDNYRARLQRARGEPATGTGRSERPQVSVPSLIGLPVQRVSLLDRSGVLWQRSGLNWGQRPELGREPNQAYIRLPSDVYNTNFFPKIGVHFTVLTDDGKVLICSRAQAAGKAIHTPHNNSLIGEYFRNRLGVSNGAPVSSDDLLRYGRTYIDFYKIDDETFYMDYSIPVSG